MSKRLNYITSEIVEKMAKKGNSEEFMKVVKNNRYKEVEALLSEGYLTGSSKGELDYLAYCHLRAFFTPNDKNKKALKVFCEWFICID